MALALADGRALLTVEHRDLGPAVVEHVVGRLAGGLARCPTTGRAERPAQAARAAARREPARRRQAPRRGWRRDVAAGGLTRSRVTFEKGGSWCSASVAPPAATPTSRPGSCCGAGEGAGCASASRTCASRAPRRCRCRAIAAARRCAAFGSHLQGESRRRRGIALEIDVLRPALDEILVAEGWRLPDSRAFASAPRWSPSEARAVVGRQASPAAPQRGPERTRRATRRRSRRCDARSTDAAAGPERAELAHQLARPASGRATRKARSRRCGSASRTPGPARWSGRPGGGSSSCTRGAAIRTPPRGR